MPVNITITKIYTEHAYVQNSILKCSVPSELDRQLLNQIHSNQISSFYRNHFVLETENKMYIGVNDGKMLIGNEIACMSDSKVIECNFKLYLKVSDLKD